MSAVRVRFAPSPTGYLHVGGGSSALFNWMFARRVGGEFSLRIEDTDAERNRPELTDNILEMLEWLGLDWDGEPVHQSDRMEHYLGAAERLFAADKAYYCECTTEQVRERAGNLGYDGFCRDRGLGPGPGRALRFRSPDEGITSFDDLIRGTISVENRTIEDFVIRRSNGAPMFLLANIIDDADMKITHVLRGEDHVNGTPKYLLLRDALELDHHPVFAHLPLLVNERRKKLSKRHDVVSVADFRDRGFLPQAMRNYLALLGWGPPDGVEVRPIEEMVELFRIEDVSPSPAMFDLKKLTDVNSEWMRRIPLDEFITRAREFVDSPALDALAPLAQERVKVLDELPEYFDWVHAPADDQRSWDKAMKSPLAADALDAIVAAYEDAPWERDELHARFIALAERLGVSPRKIDAPLRVAVTGRTVGLPLFDVFEYLGRDETLARLRAGRARLE
ncbi:MAG: glutamyl-tRNA synthetase [Acidimicrobiaceae bacterium]